MKGHRSTRHGNGRYNYEQCHLVEFRHGWGYSKWRYCSVLLGDGSGVSRALHDVKLKVFENEKKDFEYFIFSKNLIDVAISEKTLLRESSSMCLSIEKVIIKCTREGFKNTRVWEKQFHTWKSTYKFKISETLPLVTNQFEIPIIY